MIKQGLWPVMAVILFQACRQRHDGFQQVSDRQLALQLAPRTGNREDGSNFRVKVIPSREFSSSIGQETDEKMLYRMDSCFYLRLKHQKIYPVLVQPVASGLHQGYEYLVEFEPIKSEPAGNTVFVYADRYLTGKPYTIQMKDE